MNWDHRDDDYICNRCEDSHLGDCPKCDGTGLVKVEPRRKGARTKEITCPDCTDITGQMNCPDC